MENNGNEEEEEEEHEDELAIGVENNVNENEEEEEEEHYSDYSSKEGQSSSQLLSPANAEYIFTKKNLKNLTLLERNLSTLESLNMS